MELLLFYVSVQLMTLDVRKKGYADRPAIGGGAVAYQGGGGVHLGGGMGF